MEDDLKVSHAPRGYNCPFCALIDGRNAAGLRADEADVVERSAHTTTLVANTRWPANPVMLLVVPDDHHENIYTLPDQTAAELAAAARRAAIACRVALGADGVTVRQHNEPASHQTVWHLYLQVIPRWHGDRLYERHAEQGEHPAQERAEFADRLRAALPGATAR